MHTQQLIRTFFRNRGIGLACLGTALLLIGTSLPRINAAVISLSATVTIFDIDQGKDVSDQQLERAEKDIGKALTYGVNTADLNSQLSYIAFHRLLQNEPNDDNMDGYRTSLQDVKAALIQRPLDAYLWTRYTHLSYLLEGLSPYTLAALDRSFRYGSKEKELFRFRIILCLLEWERLPSTLRTATLQQIEFGASHPFIWRKILQDLPEDAADRLRFFLRQSGVE